MVPLRFTQAARKHKIGKSRVRHVIDNPLVVFRIPAPDDHSDKVNREAEIGYALDDLAPARVGRPSLSEAGDSPQVRFRLPAATRAEAAALAAREGKTLSQLARDAVEAYLSARRSA